MNKKYMKGYRFEHRVKQYLENKGYKVFRLAGSKPADLIAMKKNKTYIIECKTHKKITTKDREKIIDLAKDTQAKPVIAYRENKKIVFINPQTKTKIKL